MIQPEEILESKDFEKDIAVRLRRIISGDGQGKRIDRLKTICTRLQLAVTKADYEFKETHKKNVIDFLLNKEMDSSLRFTLHRSIVNAENSSVSKKLLRDARLAKAILKGL